MEDYNISSFLASSEGHLAGHAIAEIVWKRRVTIQPSLLYNKAIPL